MIADEAAHDDPTEEGENYFISMTDMMVGVLFIFIIMLMVFALDWRNTTDLQVSGIEQIKKELEKARTKIETVQSKVKSEMDFLDDAESQKRKILEELKYQLKAHGLDVQIDTRNGVLRLTEDAVRFPQRLSHLVGPAAQNVAKIARVLEVVLPKYSACRSKGAETSCENLSESTVETVFVEGHTDITGIDDKNWQLSTERAVNTYRELIAHAPSLRTLRNRNYQELISVSGYSSTRAVDAKDGPDAWARNRRIDLRFVMEIDGRRRLAEIKRLTEDIGKQIRDMKEPIDRLTINASVD